MKVLYIALMLFSLCYVWGDDHFSELTGVDTSVDLTRHPLGCGYITTQEFPYRLYIIPLSDGTTDQTFQEIEMWHFRVGQPASDRVIGPFLSDTTASILYLPVSQTSGLITVDLARREPVPQDSSGWYYDIRQRYIQAPTSNTNPYSTVKAPKGDYLLATASGREGSSGAAGSSETPEARPTIWKISPALDQSSWIPLAQSDVVGPRSVTLILSDTRILVYSSSSHVLFDYDVERGAVGKQWYDTAGYAFHSMTFLEHTAGASVYIGLNRRLVNSNGVAEESDGRVLEFDMSGDLRATHTIGANTVGSIAGANNRVYITLAEGAVAVYQTEPWAHEKTLRHKSISSSGYTMSHLTVAQCPARDIMPLSGQIGQVGDDRNGPASGGDEQSADSTTLVVVLSVLSIVVAVVAIVLYLVARKLAKDRQKMPNARRAAVRSTSSPSGGTTGGAGIVAALPVTATASEGSASPTKVTWEIARMNRIHPKRIDWEENPRTRLEASSAQRAVLELIQSGAIKPIRDMPARTPRSSVGTASGGAGDDDGDTTLGAPGDMSVVSPRRRAAPGLTEHDLQDHDLLVSPKHGYGNTLSPPNAQPGGNEGAPYREIGPDDLDLVGYLGSGGFADVYLARWHDIDVAVKRLKHTTGDVMRSFHKEINILSRLSHPNVALMLGGIAQQHEILIVTEYKCGGCLWDLLHTLKKNKRRLAIKQIWMLAVDICFGLDYLHNADPVILHRDLKSANILLNENGRASVVDFGLSRLAQAEKTMTRHIGTPGWMAPEVLLGSGRYTPKIDVYALGVTLWEMFSLETPFSGLENLDVISILVRDPNTRPEMPPGVPEIWINLIKECWHPNPELRPDVSHIRDLLITKRDDFSAEFQGDIVLRPADYVAPGRVGAARAARMHNALADRTPPHTPTSTSGPSLGFMDQVVSSDGDHYTPPSLVIDVNGAGVGPEMAPLPSIDGTPASSAPTQSQEGTAGPSSIRSGPQEAPRVQAEPPELV